MLGVLAMFTDGGLDTVHFLRPIPEFRLSERLGLAIDWIVCLGALTPHAVFLYFYLLKRTQSRWYMAVLITAVLLWRPQHIVSAEGSFWLHSLTRLFWINGLLVLAKA